MSFISNGQNPTVIVSQTNYVPTLQDLIGQLLGDGSRDTRSKAALALQYLSLNSENAMAILQHADALKALRFVLCNGNKEDKEYAAGAIAHLAVNEEAEQIIANSEGMISALSSLLMSGTDKAKLQAAAALENLSVSNSLLVCSHDGVVDGLTQLILNTDSLKGMEIATSVLQILALVPECRKFLRSPVLFRGLVNNLIFGTAKAKEDSASTIGNLAATNDISEEATNTPSLIDGLVDLLLNGSDRGKSDAATAVGNLAIQREMRSSILAHSHLLSGLDSMLNGQTERHKGEAAFCLQNLTICDVTHKTRIAKYGCILQGLVDLISRPKLHAQYQEDASSALLNLLVGCTENKKLVVRIEGFMEAIIFCMRHGSDRSQENSAAIIQNLAFNDHENRIFIIGHFDALKMLGELVLIGSHKTQEYALAAVSSIARSKQGSMALLQVRGMLESLVMMTQSNIPNICMHAASALQAFAQFKQAADMLLKNLVPARAFVPLLQSEANCDQKLRIQILCVMGLTSLSNFDTRVLDVIPQVAISVMVSAFKVSLHSPNNANGKPPVHDLVRSICVLCQNKDSSEYAAENLSRELVHLLTNLDLDIRNADSNSLIVEGIKLCWQLSFHDQSKTRLIQEGIGNVLAKYHLPQFADCKDIQFWATGVMVQFKIQDLKQYAIFPSASEANEANRNCNNSFFIIYDLSDWYAVEKISSILEGCGYVNKTLPFNHAERHWHSMNLVCFASALAADCWIFVAISNKSELDPYCRFKLEQSLLNGNHVIPLNVEAGYVPRAHFARWQAALQCSEDVLEGGKLSQLLSAVRNLPLKTRCNNSASINSSMLQSESFNKKTENVIEIALTLRYEYGNICNVEEFCSQVRQDVSGASGLRPDMIQIRKVVAGKEATLNLSALSAVSETKSFTTLTLALCGNGSWNLVEIVDSLVLQLRDISSKLLSGMITSKAIDLNIFNSQLEKVVESSSVYQHISPESWRKRPSSCSNLDLGSVSSVTASHEQSVNIHIERLETPVVCEAGTQADYQQEFEEPLQQTERMIKTPSENESTREVKTMDDSSKLVLVGRVENLQEPQKVVKLCHTDLNARQQSSLEIEKEEGLDADSIEHVNVSQNSNSESAANSLQIECSIHAGLENQLSSSITLRQDLELFEDAALETQKRKNLGINYYEAQNSFADAAPLFVEGSKDPGNDLIQVECQSALNMEVKTVNLHLEMHPSSQAFDLSDARESTTLTVKSERLQAHTLALDCSIQSMVGMNGREKVDRASTGRETSVSNVLKSEDASSVCRSPSGNGRDSELIHVDEVHNGKTNQGDHFLSYEPDLQMHLLVRKQDNLIKSLQGKLELLQIELQLYKNQQGKARSSSIQLTSDSITGNQSSQISLIGRVCPSKPSNSSDESEPITQKDDQKSNTSDCENIMLRTLQLSVGVQTLATEVESRGSDCCLINDDVYIQPIGQRHLPTIPNSQVKKKGPASGSVRNWADSLASVEQEKSETIVVENLNSVAELILTRLELSMDAKLKSVTDRIKEIEVKKNNFQVDAEPKKSELMAAMRANDIKGEDLLSDNKNKNYKDVPILSEFTKVTQRLLESFESKLECRLNECLDAIKDRAIISQADDQAMLLNQKQEQDRICLMDSESIISVVSVERSKQTTGVDKNENQTEYLYGLYQSQDSRNSHVTDAVSLSPTRPSSPGHPIAQPLASSMNCVPVVKFESSTCPESSQSTILSRIIAQYLPEYQINDCASELQQTSTARSTTRNHKSNDKSPFHLKPALGYDKLPIPSAGNSVLVDASLPGSVLPSPRRSTPRGISFRQLPRPRAMRALISARHCVDLDVVDSDLSRENRSGDGCPWLLGNSCSSINSTVSNTSSSSQSLWQTSPGFSSALYKRSLTKDSVRQVSDCPTTESGNSRRGRPVSVSLM